MILKNVKSFTENYLYGLSFFAHQDSGRYDEGMYRLLSTDKKSFYFITIDLYEALEKEHGNVEASDLIFSESYWADLVNPATEMAAYDDRVSCADLTQQCQLVAKFWIQNKKMSFKTLLWDTGIFVNHPQYSEPFSTRPKFFSDSAKSEIEAVRKNFKLTTFNDSRRFTRKESMEFLGDMDWFYSI